LPNLFKRAFFINNFLKKSIMIKRILLMLVALASVVAIKAQDDSSLKELDKSQWTVVDYSDCQPGFNPANIFDDEPGSDRYWQSWYGNDKGIGATDGNVNQYPLPHWIIIDLGRSYSDIVKFKVSRRTERSSIKTLEFYLADELDYIPGSNPNKDGFYPDHNPTSNPVDPAYAPRAYEVNPEHNNPNANGFVWKKIGSVEYENFNNGTYDSYWDYTINNPDPEFQAASIKSGYVDASIAASGRYLLVYMPNTNHAEKNNVSIREISLYSSEVDKSTWELVDYSDCQPDYNPALIFDNEPGSDRYWQSWYGNNMGIGATDGNVNQYPLPHWIIIDLGKTYDDITSFTVQRRTERSSIKTCEFYLADQLDYIPGSNPNRDGFYPDHNPTSNPVNPAYAPRAYEVNPEHNNPNVGGFVWQKLGQVEFENFNNGTFDAYWDYTIENPDPAFRAAAIKTGTVEGTPPAGRYLLVYMPNTNHAEKNNVSIREIALGTGGAASVYQGKPFGSYHVAPGVIQAEDFDAGGEGIAYHDQEPGHEGGGTILYRPEEGVEIEAGPGNGYHVGWTNPGEWLNYSIYAAETGYYNFDFYWASNYETSFGLAINGITVDGAITIPGTDFNTYTKIRVDSIRLDKGKSRIQIGIVHGNFDRFEITRPLAEPATNPADYAGTPYNAEAFAVPTTSPIPAVEFDRGGDGVAYHEDGETQSGNYAFRTDDAPYVDFYYCLGADGVLDQTGASGTYIGNIDNQTEWWKYTVNVAQAGYYTFVVKATSGTNDYNQAAYIAINDSVAANFILTWDNYRDGSTFLPNEWKTVSIPDVYLNAGKQIIKIWCKNGCFKDFSILQAASPRSGEAFAIPGIVPAEEYDLGGEGVAYHSTGTIQIANVETFTANDFSFYTAVELKKDEWVRYTVNVAKAGVYWAFPAIEGEGQFSLAIGKTSIYEGQRIPAIETQVVLPEGRQSLLLSVSESATSYPLQIGGFEFIEDETAYVTAIRELQEAGVRGMAYTASGTLYLKDFDARASVAVYSIAGQRIATFPSIGGDRSLTLPRGIYVVAIQDGAVRKSVKVIVK
jgi:hypothetical protein